MMWTIVAGGSLVCALIPAILYARNIRLYREPLSPKGPLPPVSLLIPARNEEQSIGPALEAALESRGIEFEIIVLDDSSEDRTAEIVQRFARRDPRVRLEKAPALPGDWCGKQHACFRLAQLARFDRLAFVDADVRLAPDGLARMVGFLESSGAELVSGFPRQATGTFVEKLVIPLIHFLLLGFLPIRRMRQTASPAFAAGCGQLFVARRKSYEAVGGHAAIRRSLHDGITLPRAYRRAGFMTDLCDVTALATCRMYRSAREVWFGLAKNAREGLASARLIVPVTALLLLGQVLPVAMLLHFIAQFACEAQAFSTPPGVDLGHYERTAVGVGLILALLATAAAYYPRLDAAFRFRQSLLGAWLHPLGIIGLLAIQWYAFVLGLFGKSSGWKGRRYPAS